MTNHSSARALPAEVVDVGLFGGSSRYGSLAFHATVDLRRALSREQLERALSDTIEDFPVLGCRYEARLWRDRWVPVDGPVSESVHVEPADDVEAQTRRWVARSLEVTRDRPLRVVCFQGDGRCRLLISMQHTAVDGGGAMAVAQALGAHLYGQPLAFEVDKRRDLAPALERLRWFHLPVLLTDMALSIVEPFKALRASVRDRPFEADARSQPSWRRLVLNAEQLARFKRCCKQQGASVNDGLIAALARVAAQRSARGPVAVVYTMDLRRYLARPRLLATNISSILTAHVDRRDIGDLAQTVAAVRRTTAKQKRRFPGLAFVLTPAVIAAGAPHLMARWFVRGWSRIAVDMPMRRALLVTNVGRLDEGLSAFGDDIEDVSIIGPTIRNVAVPAVVALGYRGQLVLQLYAGPGIAPKALDEYLLQLGEALEVDSA